MFFPIISCWTVHLNLQFCRTEKNKRHLFIFLDNVFPGILIAWGYCFCLPLCKRATVVNWVRIWRNCEELCDEVLKMRFRLVINLNVLCCLDNDWGLLMTFICLCMYHILNILHTYARIKKKKCSELPIWEKLMVIPVSSFACLPKGLHCPVLLPSFWFFSHTEQLAHDSRHNYTLFTEVITRMEETGALRTKGGLHVVTLNWYLTAEDKLLWSHLQNNR